MGCIYKMLANSSSHETNHAPEAALVLAKLVSYYAHPITFSRYIFYKMISLLYKKLNLSHKVYSLN